MELVYKISIIECRTFITILKEDIPYIPHVTVGRKESAKLVAEVVKEIPSFHGKLNCD